MADKAAACGRFGYQTTSGTQPLATIENPATPVTLMPRPVLEPMMMRSSSRFKKLAFLATVLITAGAQNARAETRTASALKPTHATAPPGSGQGYHGMRLHAGAGLDQAPTCEHAPKLHIKIDRSHGDVAVLTDLTLAQLDEMAARLGKPGKHKPLGFYSSTFFYTIQVDLLNTGDSPCTTTIRLSLTMALAERRIQIGRDLVGDPCRFSAALAHYGQHAAFDDTLLDLFGQRTAATLKNTPFPIFQGDAQTVEDVRERTSSFARGVVERGLPDFHAQRDSVADMVDTPEEVRKLESGCSSHA